MTHECKSHQEWLMNVHYMCSCGHVEWAHYGDRLNKGRCAHCNCTQYNGETRPLTDFEKEKKNDDDSKGSV
jgi:hypothetical protein